MNKSDYQEKIKSMLQDWKTCQPITDKWWNRTTKTALDLQKKLQNLNDSGNLSEEEYKKLWVSDPNPASFYDLKVHKVEPRPNNDRFIILAEDLSLVPLRPINSCISTPTYQVSKYFAKVLGTLTSG